MLLAKSVKSCRMHKGRLPSFLVHMSRRLKCTIVITRCPSSVVRPYVRHRWLSTFYDLSSETAERNSMKFDRKQDLNVLYQAKFVLFRADRKNKKADRPLIGWDIFSFSSETAEWNSTKLDRKQNLNAPTIFVIFGPMVKNKMAALPLISWNISDLSSETIERNATKQQCH